MVAGDGLLVLANGTAQDHGILLYYTDKDGNHKVDTNELTVVDIFSDGAAHAADIQLVGSGIAIPP